MAYQQYIDSLNDAGKEYESSYCHGSALLWRQRLERALLKLESASKQLELIEAQHEEFMNRYYAAVGVHCEELATLEAQIGGAADDAPITLQAVSEYMLRSPQTDRPQKSQISGSSKEVAKHLKQLYRSMVKECHPDHRRVNDTQEWMQKLNDAYEQRSLAALWRVKCDLRMHEAMPGEISDRHWQQEVMHVQEWYARLSARLAELQTSHTHALMQRALQLKLCGQDFLQIVQDNLKQQIEAKKRGLVVAKIKRNSLRYVQTQQLSAATHTTDSVD